MERTQELDEARREAEFASQAKLGFLAHVSHELLAPLNAVISFSHIMTRQTFGPINERNKAYAQDIQNSGENLLALINDVLDISKIEAGEITSYIERVDLVSELEHCLKLLKPALDEKALSVELKIETSFAHVNANRTRLRQVFNNLLSNAIKFSPKRGQISVGAYKLEISALWLSISKDGAGIPEAKIPEIFEPFQQVSGPLVREQQGIGSGLSIVRSIIELHNFTIRIYSCKGKGTTVEILIPGDAVPRMEADQLASRA